MSSDSTATSLKQDDSSINEHKKGVADDAVTTREEDARAYRWSGTLQIRIVGLQHHDAIANFGGKVSLAREAQNPFDENAIRVDNQDGNPVGYIPQANAAVLAPLLDSEEIVITQGTVTQEPGIFTCPVKFGVYIVVSDKRRKDICDLLLRRLKPEGRFKPGESDRVVKEDRVSSPRLADY